MRRGSTLIELIYSIVIFAGLMLIVMNIFYSVKDFSTDEEHRLVVGETAARALSTFDDTIRQGRLIIANSTINGETYTTGDSTVVFTVPSLVSGIPTAASDTIVITRNTTTNELIEITAPNSNSERTAGTRQLSTNVSDVYFRYTTDDPTSSTAITVIITATQTANHGPYSRTSIVYETLRNHP